MPRQRQLQAAAIDYTPIREVYLSQHYEERRVVNLRVDFESSNYPTYELCGNRWVVPSNFQYQAGDWIRNNFCEEIEPKEPDTRGFGTYDRRFINWSRNEL